MPLPGRKLKKIRHVVDMKILRLTLYKQWFDKIASGEKKEEYRANKPYWKSRLLEKNYDEVHFRNGYNPDSPFMRVKWLGTDFDKRNTRFVIRLGEVLEITEYQKYQREHK
jgi:hypothetical protein